MLWLRLAFDLASISLLSLAVAYHWQGNRVHEIAGMAMFALVVIHNGFNRRWYGSLASRRTERRGRIDIVSTGLLLAMMGVLLVTSFLISETVFPWLALQGDGIFGARQLHAFAAYWLLIMVAVHLGLRWPMLMAVARRLFGITRPSRARRLVLRSIAMSIALAGINAWSALGIGAKLTLQTSLDWWNFEDAVLPFFAHCLAFVGMGIVLMYYATRWLQRTEKQAGRRTAKMTVGR